MEQKEIRWWEKEFKELVEKTVLSKDENWAEADEKDLEAFISRVELDARKDERERVLGEVEKAKTFSVTHPKMFGGEVEETYINKKDIISILKGLSGNNE